MNTVLERDLASYVDERTDRLVGLLRDLVRRPSENRAPEGAEQACQEYIAATLRASGWEPRLYTPDSVAGLTEHPLYWPGRSYANRPNVAAVRKGAGGGRSLLLSGHIDTVPAGAAHWERGPFGGEVEGRRLYGRGSVDMKAGVAANLFVATALAELGISLQGDLTFESVVDEEFGGVNGTLAGRVAGYRADGVVLSEPTAGRVSPGQRGGRTVHLTLSAPNGGILAGMGSGGVVEQLRVLLNAVPAFAAERRATAPVHPLYAHLADPVPVTVARISTAAWGTSEPPNVPPECRVELFWQTMPGETLEEIDGQFAAWLAGVTAHPAFIVQPRLEHPIRWLPGAALEAGNAFVEEFTTQAAAVLGRRPEIRGIEGPCDLYVFHEFGMPALLWGAAGGNAHMADEYVEIDSMIETTKALLAFVCNWCGVMAR